MSLHLFSGSHAIPTSGVENQTETPSQTTTAGQQAPVSSSGSTTQDSDAMETPMETNSTSTAEPSTAPSGSEQNGEVNHASDNEKEDEKEEKKMEAEEAVEAKEEVKEEVSIKAAHVLLFCATYLLFAFAFRFICRCYVKLYLC